MQKDLNFKISIDGQKIGKKIQYGTRSACDTWARKLHTENELKINKLFRLNAVVDGSRKRTYYYY